jgi:cell division protein YceG involved in septum cleavage
MRNNISKIKLVASLVLVLTAMAVFLISCDPTTSYPETPMGVAEECMKAAIKQDPKAVKKFSSKKHAKFIKENEDNFRIALEMYFKRRFIKSSEYEQLNDKSAVVIVYLGIKGGPTMQQVVILIKENGLWKVDDLKAF